MKPAFFLASALFLNALSFATPAKLKVLCYYESWGSYAPEDIDVTTCTHINYSFLGLNDDGSLRLDANDATIQRLVALKSTNPSLKVLVSVGGWGEGSIPFSKVAAGAAQKARLAASAVALLQQYQLDGLDVDWEYPGQRGGTPADRDNFVDMLQVIRGAFDRAASNYLLTIAVPFFTNSSSYNVPGLNALVDYINVMTYDVHHPTDGKTGQNSPLYAASSDTAEEKESANCNASIVNWMAAGADAGKLALGLGFYGKAYQLADAEQHGVNAPAVGESAVGANSYPAICRLVDGWTEVWDDEQKNPYKYKGTDWIGYDNERSIALKVQFANERGLGGVMMWAVDEDDKDGVCGTKNALLNAIKNNL